MFCVECGSEEKLYGHLCRKCILSKNLIKPPEYVAVQVCLGCGKVMDGPVWKNMPPEDVAASEIGKATRTHAQVSSVRWSVPNFPAEKGEHRVVCTAHLLIADQELSLDSEVGIRVRFQKCQSCSRQSGDYYEAIIQLRLDGLNAKDAEKELAIENEVVFKMVDEHSGSDENAFITKYSPVKGGMDFYMGSAALARAIANKFRNRFGATINESPSLFGMKDGRDIYRYSILVRLPGFREGDVVALAGKLYSVESGDGKMLALKSARNGQIERVSPGESRLKLVARYHEIRDAVVVTHDRSTIQVLDPDSMAAVTISRPSYMKKIGETVSVVRYDDALHAV
ncbi:MAG: NMD3-related protein [Thermoplasmata archaeon]